MRTARTMVAVAALVALAAGCGGDDAATSPTDAPVTAAPATDPPQTEPVATEPVATEPPATELPAAEVVMSGTAYEFNTPDPIAGAEIRIEELPDLVATTGTDGSYALALPADTEVTPYIVADGFHSIHHQVFDTGDTTIQTDGALVNVNFQTPTEDIYDALFALLEGQLGGPPIGEDSCVIVTTVSDPRVVGMTFAEFIDFHPHGVEGVTATATPKVAGRVPEAMYFNDDVLPDVTQELSSIDGGVLWPNVPAGRYTLAATHPTVSFAEITVRCDAGWVVNANPPWGLHGLP